MLPAPRACPSAAPSDAQGGKGRCTGTSLLELEGSKVCVDYQEIKIQDQVRKLLPPMSRLPLSFPFSLQLIITNDTYYHLNPACQHR